MITEVTEKDVEREPVTTQIKDTESMEYTVEIVVHYYHSVQCDQHLL